LRILLGRRLRREPSGFVQLLSGPRQVGKTTLLHEIVAEWGARALYASADGPEAALPGWWDNLWQRAEMLAQNRPSILLLDEIRLENIACLANVDAVSWEEFLLQGPPG